MEILIKKTFILVLPLLIFTKSLQSQDFQPLIDAFGKSYRLEASGDYEKAATALKAVYDSKSYETNLRLGWLLYNAGQYTESVEYYSKAVALMPYAIEPRMGLAFPLSAMEKWTELEKQYLKILEICPNYSVTLYRMGLIYYYREDYDQAARYFEKVVNLYPFDYDALVMMGWTMYKQNNQREAKILFNKALMNNPEGNSALKGLDLIP